METNQLDEVLDEIARSINYRTVRRLGAKGSIAHIKQRIVELKSTNPNMDVDRFLAICFFGGKGEYEDLERLRQLRENLAKN